MQFILIRHGQTAWNRQGRFQGQSRVGLDRTGLTQAIDVAKASIRFNPSAIYSSPLPRALMTARAISKISGLPILKVDGFMEISLGDLEGVKGDLMKLKYPSIYHAWNRDPSKVVFPNGESIQQLQARACDAIRRIEIDNQCDTAIVVSHNFAIRTILCASLGLPLSQFHSLNVDLGSISIIDNGLGASRVITINDKCHLSG